MKILDRYILTTYLKTFMSVFIILMLIFILQSIWLYISELAGKDLAFSVIIKFLIYVTPTLIPLILPLTILLASIMVFGNFAENYEFAAMKSSGISLQRAMRSLSVFIILLSITTFFFANNMIPWANFNFYNLRKNIAKTLPAMAIAEGQFNEVGYYNIKVEEKSGDKGQYLKDVYIHKKSSNRSGNYTVISSKTGELISSENSNILQLVLHEGNYYEEIYSKDPKERQKSPHARSYFDKYTINVDLEGLNDVDYEDKSFQSRYNMLNAADLDYTIDSLQNQETNELKSFSKTLYDRTSIDLLKNHVKTKKDSAFTGDLLTLFDDTSNLQILNHATNSTASTKQIIKSKSTTMAAMTKWRNRHIVSLHEKFALGFACIILFFVGAPLGALIRKGGFGLPLVVAILLFLTYHFIGIFAKNSSYDNSINPVFATWLSTLIMLPLSIFLTRRATKDRGLFEFDSFLEPLKKILKLKTEKDKNRLTIAKKIETYSDEQLIAILKNKDSFKQNHAEKGLAYRQLNKLGYSNNDLSQKGITVGPALVQSQTYAKTVKDYGLTTAIAYGIGAVLIILFLVFRNNKLPELAEISRNLAWIAGLFFVIYSIVSTVYLSKFYASLKESSKTINYLLLILGFLVFPITYMLIKNQVKEELFRSSIENIK